MNIARRDFLKQSALFAATAAFPQTPVPAFTPVPGKWRTFELTTTVEILKPEGTVRAWLPIPAFRADDWMRPGDIHWEAPGSRASTKHQMLDITWAPDVIQPKAVLTCRVSTRDRATDFSKPGKYSIGTAERRAYTSPTRMLPTDGLVKETADKIVAAVPAADDHEKARRIYEWIVANTFRDPKVRGCGVGDVASMLRVGNLGGKCADLNALFVALARASGLPARDIYGIRVAPSQFGYKALGANSEVVTKSQHCRAEVFLTRFGWVPADPADVRKVVLEEPPGNLPIDDAKVAAAHRTLFGAWETNWIAFNDFHDVTLPESAVAKPTLPFLMYPQAETAAGRLDCLDADQFKYAITAKEV